MKARITHAARTELVNDSHSVRKRSLHRIWRSQLLRRLRTDASHPKRTFTRYHRTGCR